MNLHSYAAITATPNQNVRSSPTTDDEPPLITDTSAMSTNFVDFARQKLNVHRKPYDISTIHDLPPRHNGKRPVSVQLHSSGKKAELIKCIDIYINDHILSYNSDLFRHDRQLKILKKIQCVETALLRLHKG